MKIIIQYSLIIVAFSLTGCALHPPISESILFDRKIKSDYESTLLNDSEQTDDESFVLNLNSFSLNKSFYSKNFESKALKEHNLSDEFSLNVLWQYGLSAMNLIFHPDDKLYVGINPSLIFNFGIDFTYQAFKNIYYRLFKCFNKL